MALLPWLYCCGLTISVAAGFCVLWLSAAVGGITLKMTDTKRKEKKVEEGKIGLEGYK